MNDITKVFPIIVDINTYVINVIVKSFNIRYAKKLWSNYRHKINGDLINITESLILNYS